MIQKPDRIASQTEVSRQVGEGRRPHGPFEVAVQLDLGQVAGEGEDVHPDILAAVGDGRHLGPALFTRSQRLAR